MHRYSRMRAKCAFYLGLRLTIGMILKFLKEFKGFSGKIKAILKHFKVILKQIKAVNRYKSRGYGAPPPTPPFFKADYVK